jgi:undecaprenyl-diphosphatase
VSAPAPPTTPIDRPPPLWPYRLAFAALAVLGLAFGEMAEAARRQVPDALDSRVMAWVYAHRDHWPGLTRFFHAVTWFGNPSVATSFTIAVAVLLLFLGRRRIGRLRRREAVFWLFVLISGRSLNLLLKAHFQRQRPPIDFRLVEEDSFSFPSGHSVYSAIFCAMLAILLAREIPASRAWLRIAVVTALATLAGLVGISRIWLGVHYPTDVVGGLLLGVGWVIIAYLLRYGGSRWIARKRQGVV